MLPDTVRPGLAGSVAPLKLRDMPEGLGYGEQEEGSGLDLGFFGELPKPTKAAGAKAKAAPKKAVVSDDMEAILDEQPGDDDDEPQDGPKAKKSRKSEAQGGDKRKTKDASNEEDPCSALFFVSEECVIHFIIMSVSVSVSFTRTGAA